MTLSEMMNVKEGAIKTKKRLEAEAAQLDRDIADLEARKREAIARGDTIGNAEYEAADSKQRRMKARREYIGAALMVNRPNVTRAEGLMEWGNYAANFNEVIESKLFDYQMACRDLCEKFVELAALQNEAMKVRGKLCDVLEAVEGGQFRILGNQPDPAMAPVKMIGDNVKGEVVYQGEYYSPDVAFFAERGLIPANDACKFNNIVNGAPVNLTE